MTASWRLVVRVEDEGLMEHGSGQREDKYWTIEALSNFWSLITDLLSLRLIWALRYHHKMRCMGGRNSAPQEWNSSNCCLQLQGHIFHFFAFFFFFLPQRHQKETMKYEMLQRGILLCIFQVWSMLTFEIKSHLLKTQIYSDSHLVIVGPLRVQALPTYSP